MSYKSQHQYKPLQLFIGKCCNYTLFRDALWVLKKMFFMQPKHLFSAQGFKLSATNICMETVNKKTNQYSIFEKDFRNQLNCVFSPSTLALKLFEM